MEEDYMAKKQQQQQETTNDYDSYKKTSWFDTRKLTHETLD